MKHRRITAITITILVLAITAISQRTSRLSGSSQISESALRAHIKFLSDDRLEGRGTGARGGELAALYAAEQFEAMGLKGAGKNGSFWQPVSLVGVKADPKPSCASRVRAEARLTNSRTISWRSPARRLNTFPRTPTWFLSDMASTRRNRDGTTTKARPTTIAVKFW